jgi:dTDP-4-amino-4,6-dideoxygalactose transaminase
MTQEVHAGSQGVWAAETVASTADARLVAKARRALALWERRCSEPTSNLLGTGAVHAFEQGVAGLLGCRHALSVPSATLGLRVALEAAGVGAGDHVLVPAYDWTAAIAAVHSIGAVAVAVDVEHPGCGLAPGAVEAGLRRAVTAVVVTHLFGVPARVEEIASLCRSNDVPLIEDCSQALGATVAGRPVGSFGDLAVCSFGPNKILDTADGGVVSTNDDSLYERCCQLSQHPLRQTLVGIDEPNPVALGLRMHPLAVILGVAELDGMARALEGRRASQAELAERLESHGWVHARRTAVEPIGPALPVLAGSGRHAPGVVFGRPCQHLIAPPHALALDPSRQARRVEELVLLAQPAWR